MDIVGDIHPGQVGERNTSHHPSGDRSDDVWECRGHAGEWDRVGNAEKQDFDKTYVISWHSDISAAQQVANIINCQNVESRAGEVKQSEDPIQDLDSIDVTVILGKDFDCRYCKN